MSVDPEDLAVAALRRDGDPTAIGDIADRAGLDALRRVVSIGRALTSHDTALHDPPPDLWSRIAGEAFADPADGSGEGPSGDGGRPTAPTLVAAPDSRRSASGGEVVDLASRRARRRTLLGAVAASLVLIVGIGALVVSQGSEPRNELVASADLSLLAGGGSGSAELVEKDDGLHLLVDVSGLEPAQAADFYELWLIAPDFGDMESMTRFDRSTDAIDVRLPEGMDPEEFPVVDISEEVDDGDDTHSGLSILRGSLA